MVQKNWVSLAGEQRSVSYENLFEPAFSGRRSEREGSVWKSLHGTVKNVRGNLSGAEMVFRSAKCVPLEGRDPF